MKATSQPSDVIHTKLVNRWFNTLGPTLTMVVNMSLSEGNIPNKLKIGYITLLLKKPYLFQSNPNNRRPVMGLPFLTKLFEKASLKEIQSYIET